MYGMCGSEKGQGSLSLEEGLVYNLPTRGTSDILGLGCGGL